MAGANQAVGKGVNMKRWIPLFSAVCIASTSSAFAATNSWNGGDGSRDAQGNWSLHQRPDSG